MQCDWLSSWVASALFGYDCVCVIDFADVVMMFGRASRVIDNFAPSFVENRRGKVERRKKYGRKACIEMKASMIFGNMICVWHF